MIKTEEELHQKNRPYFLESESGVFFLDEHGIVEHFEPSIDNPFIDERTEKGSVVTQKSIRSLIVPEGVRGFVSEFMRGVRVLERFELPNGLLSIGNNSFSIEDEQHCVFANSILPSVVIPETVQVIGNFAFGASHIECLQLPAMLRSEYGRQFKDGYIGVLKLPVAWKSDVEKDKYGCLRLKGDLRSDRDFGYLRWPSTHVERLEFY
jgi:hypothetical protein